MRRHSARNSAALIALLAVAVLVLSSATHAASEGSIVIAPSEIVQRALGHNSLSGALLRDGTVCLTANMSSLTCEPLMRVPPDVVKPLEAHLGFFDGIFDLDKCGSPEVFIEYWPARDDPNCPAKYRDESYPRCDVISLFVYKKNGRDYRKAATLNAPTMGYDPDAWFVDDSTTPKAIFMTRYGGSSGNGLFYLNWKKQALELISDDYYCGAPLFEDFDGDGHSDIFITSRGYDRTAKQGAALLHWKDGHYQLWWPEWAAPPYVMYAQAVTIRSSRTPLIVAVVDPEARELDDPRGEMISRHRTLAIWQLIDSSWKMTANKEIEGVTDPDLMCAFPELSGVASGPDGATISLSYRDDSVISCRFDGRVLSCHKKNFGAAGPEAQSK